MARRAAPGASTILSGADGPVTYPSAPSEHPGWPGPRRCLTPYVPYNGWAVLQKRGNQFPKIVYHPNGSYPITGAHFTLNQLSIQTHPFSRVAESPDPNPPSFCCN